MAITMCPGQDTSFWGPQDIFDVECSNCGNEVEFFKDDASRRCSKCGGQVANPKLNLGCAQWCEHAKECLGYDPKEKLAAEGEHTSLVDRLIEALSNLPGGDELRSAGIKAMEHAKTIMGTEGGDPKVILSAALLSPLEPEKARGLLSEQEVDLATSDDVAKLLAALDAGTEPADLQAKVVADAIALAEGAPAKLHTNAAKVLAQQQAPGDAGQTTVNQAQ